METGRQSESQGHISGLSDRIGMVSTVLEGAGARVVRLRAQEGGLIVEKRSRGAS